jgi:hypothetical protein
MTNIADRDLGTPNISGKAQVLTRDAVKSAQFPASPPPPSDGWQQGEL